MIIKETTPSLEIFKFSFPQQGSVIQTSFLVLYVITKIVKNSKARLVINLSL